MPGAMRKRHSAYSIIEPTWARFLGKERLPFMHLPYHSGVDGYLET